MCVGGGGGVASEWRVGEEEERGEKPVVIGLGQVLLCVGEGEGNSLWSDMGGRGKGYSCIVNL